MTALKASGATAPDLETMNQDYGYMTQWLQEKVEVLRKASRDTSIFERGSMRLRGNEKIKAGTFVRLKRSRLDADYYATSVTHDFQPMHGFFTTVNFERGEGYIKRLQTDSPYLEEMNTKGTN